MTLLYMGWRAHQWEFIYVDGVVQVAAVPIAVCILCSFGFSKYGCWLGVFVKVLLMDIFPSWHNYTILAIPAVWCAWAVAQFSIASVFKK